MGNTAGKQMVSVQRNKHANVIGHRRCHDGEAGGFTHLESATHSPAEISKNCPSSHKAHHNQHKKEPGVEGTLVLHLLPASHP